MSDVLSIVLSKPILVKKKKKKKKKKRTVSLHSDIAKAQFYFAIMNHALTLSNILATHIVS